MEYSTAWWFAAGAAVCIELMTGTFYLLMIAIGLGAGALAATTGASFTTQLIVASIVGSASVMGQYYRRKLASKNLDPNGEVSMDIGETVNVELWNADQTTRVRYRGANWKARLQKGQEATSGSFVITEIIGSQLVLKHV